MEKAFIGTVENIAIKLTRLDERVNLHTERKRNRKCNIFSTNRRVAPRE